ncbi:TonB-dependent receptor [Rhodoplanes serenus]|uniref:TonB-dependent receptor n=1 Tax=Rhodoplanes serenus TaxID=200615 RepID=A0A9X4XMD8_9BRAD|nr:TonB-dependent receptor [Rhodoplanes serenus]MTW17873.1 TonB-dependent receptor [Rhodoplanes serenus]
MTTARIATTRLAAVAIGAAVLADAAAAQSVALDELVVTATGRPEPRSRIPETVQVIDQERIRHSSARSVTELLVENAVGFFSDWSPAQTSINIRGAASDGQGRDFKGQVLVLINGRRAGTANLSKLSAADVERIEVVRGPASVIYGSQNIGGVINLIMKTGRTAPGTVVETSGGSFGQLRGKAQSGGVRDAYDWYVGVSGGKSDNVTVGGGTKALNTAWTRGGASAAFGLQIDPNQRIDLAVRTDGVYDAGFRGSTANIYSRDDRFNRSVDLVYDGKIPDGWASLMVQTYAVTDVDVFKWASPVIASGNRPVAGTLSDRNERTLDIVGTRVQPRFKPWTGNELLLGLDGETSWLRSDRTRVYMPGSPIASQGQVAPYDANQTEAVYAFYAEDAQTLLDDRVTVRGGVRRTQGETSFDPTPNLARQRTGSQSYAATTWSAGATWAMLDGWSWRLGASTGFRAPTASELAADFTAVGGGRIFGNAGLQPETAQQIEVGTTFSGSAWRIDVALFQNLISNRIVTRARTGVPNTSDYVNNPADIVVRGVEMQANADMLAVLARPAGPWRWTIWANGAYNFDMRDEGAPAAAGTDRATRMYQYQAAIGTRFGQTGGPWRDWSIQVAGVLHGPMWYASEEYLLIPGQVRNTTVYRKDPYWVWNLRGEIALTEQVKLFATINNLFDVNAHPIFLALDQVPCLADPRFQNGGCGTSMPGREMLVGLRAQF